MLHGKCRWAQVSVQKKDARAPAWDKSPTIAKVQIWATGLCEARCCVCGGSEVKSPTYPKIRDMWATSRK